MEVLLGSIQEKEAASILICLWVDYFLFEVYSYIVFFNQNPNFDFFCKNSIIETKEIHDHTTFISSNLSRINSGALDAVPTSRVFLDKALMSVDRA